MARLQILQLPPYSQDNQPFALVLDRCAANTPFGADWQRFAEQSGARSFIATDQEVDLDGDMPEVDIPEDAMDAIVAMIRREVQDAVNEAAGVRPEVVEKLDSMGLLPKPEKQPQRQVWGAGDRPDPRANIPGWEPPTEAFGAAAGDLIGSAVDKAVGRG